MTTILAAGAALMTRALGAAFLLLVLLIVSIVAGTHLAFAQEVVSAQLLPRAASDVPTVTLLRDGVILVALVFVGFFAVWRLTLIEKWVRSRITMQDLAAVLIEDELIKRGVIQRPHPPLPPEPLPPVDEQDQWVAEANKVAPPPPPPPRRPHVPSTKSVAHTFSARTRAKGNA
jgi:hypothetical protein